MSEVRKPNVTDQGKIGITHKFVSSVYIDHTILNTSGVRCCTTFSYGFAISAAIGWLSIFSTDNAQYEHKLQW